jgi:hypothetical protein
MDATFKLDPNYTLEIRTNDPSEGFADNVAVHLIKAARFSGSSIDGVVTEQNEPTVTTSFWLKPSFARAIASAILSAATEARG